MLQCVAVCCSVLQYVAVRCSVLYCVLVYCSVLQCVAECCNVLQCVAACCSVLQCVLQCNLQYVAVSFSCPRYQANTPTTQLTCSWPLPESTLAGCKAHYDSSKIRLIRIGLSHARRDNSGIRWIRAS